MGRFGVLFPGELGAAFAAILRLDGHDVLTCLEGRSDRTRAYCAEAGIRVFGTLEEVAQCADVILSLVTPDSALEMAEKYAGVAGERPPHQLYLDCNSVAPGTVLRIQEVLGRRDIELVDAAVVGPAARLGADSAIYLSGVGAAEAATYFESRLRVTVLGSKVGSASGLKMLLAGMNKGIAALFIEMGLVACELDALSVFLDQYRRQYPGVAEILDRMLPSYPIHAKRRAGEMQELAGMMRTLELEPMLVGKSAELIRKFEELNWDARKEWSSQSVLMEAARKNPLR